MTRALGASTRESRNAYRPALMHARCTRRVAARTVVTSQRTVENDCGVAAPMLMHPRRYQYAPNAHRPRAITGALATLLLEEIPRWVEVVPAHTDRLIGPLKKRTLVPPLER